MKIGALQKFSLIEYPEKISAIVFTQGCNFRCGYCHNPELVDEKLFMDVIPEEEILSFLENRKGKLDAVVITGGEPLIQEDIESFIKKIKDIGYLVKLDTNGSFPEKLKNLTNKKFVDYIAMDIKAPLEKYELITKVKINKEKILHSIEIIMNSDINYEFRTTIVKSQLSREDILKIGKLIKGAKLYALQKFIVSKHLDKRFFNESTYKDSILNELKDELEAKYVKKCIVR
ncbi:MAG: anaerobic ribonucleoside-triphosphate reductase activating protein [Candidatus Altiarchaeota archaeon]